jgi:hypothetical protein
MHYCILCVFVCFMCVRALARLYIPPINIEEYDWLFVKFNTEITPRWSSKRAFYWFVYLFIMLPNANLLLRQKLEIIRFRHISEANLDIGLWISLYIRIYIVICITGHIPIWKPHKWNAIHTLLFKLCSSLSQYPVVTHGNLPAFRINFLASCSF